MMMTYTQSQKDDLQAWLEHNPYPEGETWEQLAKCTGIPISKLQIWFRNRRYKWRKLESKCSLGKEQTQEQVQSQLETQENFSTNARKHQALLTKTQIQSLLEVFKSNRSPDTATRQVLAGQIGIKESRIQVWFEKQRSLCPEQEREPENFITDGINVRPHLATQQQQINLLAHPMNYLPFSDVSYSHQALQLSPLASHETFIPWVSRVSESQVPSVMIMHPTQPVQTGGNPGPSLACGNHLPEQPILGEGFSDTQIPLYPQPDAEHQKQQPEDLSHADISYIMQWWEKDRLALIAEWEPLKGACTDSSMCQQQAQSAREPFHPLSQQHQGLDEVLSQIQ